VEIESGPNRAGSAVRVTLLDQEPSLRRRGEIGSSGWKFSHIQVWPGTGFPA